MGPSFDVGTRDNIHDNFLSTLLHLLKLIFAIIIINCKLLAAAP